MTIRKTINLIISACSVLAAIALAIMMMATVVDVFMANAFQSPIIGTYDLVECTLVAVVFLSFPTTFLRDKHILVDIIDFFVSERVLTWIKRIALLVTVASLLILAWQMIQPAYDYYRFGEQKPELGIPIWPLWIPMIFGIVLSALAAMLSQTTQKARDTEREEDQ